MAKLVLGCGESTVPEVRNASNEPENWTLARVLWPNTTRELVEGSKAPGDRWCVLVDHVSDADLDADNATDCYRTVHDFDAAIVECQGVDSRDMVARNGAVDRMCHAGVIE